MPGSKDRKWIFLIGFSGSGKSTIGPGLAARLGRPFVDLDSLIEKRMGRSIPGIFEQLGEPVFRRLERATLKKCLKQRSRGVLALGGGAFESPEVRELTAKYGVTVFLSCSIRELSRRLKGSENRPLLSGRARHGETPAQARLRRIRTLLNKRLANYRRADLIHSTTGRSAAQSVIRLYRLLKDMA